MQTGWEWDLLGKSARYHTKSAGVRKYVKRTYNKRDRRAAKQRLDTWEPPVLPLANEYEGAHVCWIELGRTDPRVAREEDVAWREHEASFAHTPTFTVLS